MSSNGLSERASEPHASSLHANELRTEIARLEKALGRRPKLLVAELGASGRENTHGHGVELLARKARDAGFDVVYEGASATPEQVVTSAVEEDVHLIGLALPRAAAPGLVGQLAACARAAGIGAVPVVVAAHESALDSVIDELVELAAKASAH